MRSREPSTSRAQQIEEGEKRSVRSEGSDLLTFETAVKDLNILLISKQSNEASWKNQEEGEGGRGVSKQNIG